MISVLLSTESHFPVDRNKLRSSVIEFLARRIRHAAEVSISIVGDRLMKKLNTTYRKINETTDVLSFPLNDPGVSGAFVEPPDKVLRLGDIVVSYPQAVAEAASDNMLVDDKIVELVFHGLDHLLGIHHDEG